MTFIEKLKFRSLKTSKMSSIWNTEVLFFGEDGRDTSQLLYLLFIVHKHNLQPEREEWVNKGGGGGYPRVGGQSRETFSVFRSGALLKGAQA